MNVKGLPKVSLQAAHGNSQKSSKIDSRLHVFRQWLEAKILVGNLISIVAHCSSYWERHPGLSLKVM